MPDTFAYRGYTIEEGGTEDRPHLDISDNDGRYKCTIEGTYALEKAHLWIDRDIRNCYLRDGRYETFEL